MRLYILTGKSRNLKLLYNEAVNNSIYNSVGLYVCIYFNLIVTNKNEIPPKLNDCSRFYFKILYFLRQQYLLSLFFCNVYFFFPYQRWNLFPFEFELSRLICLPEWPRNALVLSLKVLCSRKHLGPRQREVVDDPSHHCDVLTNGIEHKYL